MCSDLIGPPATIYYLICSPSSTGHCMQLFMELNPVCLAIGLFTQVGIISIIFSKTNACIGVARGCTILGVIYRGKFKCTLGPRQRKKSNF